MYGFAAVILSQTYAKLPFRLRLLLFISMDFIVPYVYLKVREKGRERGRTHEAWGRASFDCRKNWNKIEFESELLPHLNTEFFGERALIQDPSSFVCFVAKMLWVKVSREKCIPSRWRAGPKSTQFRRIARGGQDKARTFALTFDNFFSLLIKINCLL